MWSSNKHGLYHEAMDKHHKLFPNLIDESGSSCNSSNAFDDSVVLTGLAVKIATVVDIENGQAIFLERDDEEEIEQQLVDYIAQDAVSLHDDVPRAEDRAPVHDPVEDEGN